MKLHLRADEKRGEGRRQSDEANAGTLYLTEKWLGSCSFDVQQLKTNLHSAT